MGQRVLLEHAEFWASFWLLLMTAPRLEGVGCFFVVGVGMAHSRLLPSEAWKPQQGTEGTQSILGKRELAGGPLLGSKGSLDVSSWWEFMDLLLSLLQRLGNQLAVSVALCSNVGL